MSCCCAPEDDSERLFLRERSRTKHDDGVVERDLGYGGYEDLSGSGGDERDSKFSPRKICCGYGFALAGALTLATSVICTDIIGLSVPYSQLNGLRFTAQLINITPFLIGGRKCDVRIQKDLIGWTILGAVLLLINNYSYYGTVYFLPPDVASGIICCLVLFFNYFISCIVEKVVRWYELLAFIMCVAGVVMITQPQYIFQGYYDVTLPSIVNNTNVNTTSPPSCGATSVNSSANYLPFPGRNNRHLEEGKPDMIGYVLCVVAAVSGAAYMQLIKWKLTELNIFAYNFWASLLGATVSFVAMAVTETPFFPTSTICIVFVLIHASTAASHAITVFRAFQLVDPVVSSLILTLIVAIIFIYQYTLLPWLNVFAGTVNILEVFGGILLFFGSILVGSIQLIQVLRKKKEEAKQPERNILEEDFEFMNRIHY